MPIDRKQTAKIQIQAHSKERFEKSLENLTHLRYDSINSQKWQRVSQADDDAGQKKSDLTNEYKELKEYKEQVHRLHATIKKGFNNKAKQVYKQLEVAQPKIVNN